MATPTTAAAATPVFAGLRPIPEGAVYVSDVGPTSHGKYSVPIALDHRHETTSQTACPRSGRRTTRGRQPCA